MPAKLLPPPANVRMLWPQAQARRLETEILQRAQQIRPSSQCEAAARERDPAWLDKRRISGKDRRAGPGGGQAPHLRNVPRCVRVWLETKLPDAANSKPEEQWSEQDKSRDLRHTAKIAIEWKIHRRMEHPVDRRRKDGARSTTTTRYSRIFPSAGTSKKMLSSRLCQPPHDVACE